MTIRPLALFIALLALMPLGCEIASSEDEARIVAGVDVDALFAEPTSTEIDAVLADWASRETPATDVQVEHTATFGLADTPATVRIVSHTVQGTRHYGAIVTPEGLAPGSAPVIVYAHGGDQGVSVDGEVGFLSSVFRSVSDRFVYVVPSFRDEELRFEGEVWRSEGPASPWDRDVDDALALLSVAGQIEPAVDSDRVVVLGFSRGAGVGLLMDARDDRIDAVIEFFGPTDFFGPFVQDVTIEALEGAPRNLPGLDVLNERYLTPMSEGTLLIDEVRVELVRRSPALFMDRLGRVQLHHGTADQIVPISQAQRLISAADRAGKTDAEFEAFIYEGGEHNPLTLLGSLDRALVLLEDVLQQE